MMKEEIVTDRDKLRKNFLERERKPIGKIKEGKY